MVGLGDIAERREGKTETGDRLGTGVGPGDRGVVGICRTWSWTSTLSNHLANHLVCLVLEMISTQGYVYSKVSVSAFKTRRFSY